MHTNDYDYAATRENAEEYDETQVFKREEFASMKFETAPPGRARAPGDRRALTGARPLREELRRLNASESTALFNLLQNRVTKLENTIRWTWQQGDVAIWDNRATQHYAVADFDEQRREVRRITVAGDIPVSIDGRRSEVILGDASEFAALDSLIS